MKNKNKNKNKSRVFYREVNNGDELDDLCKRDKDRFREAHFKSPETANQKQLSSRLIFSSHSLEKSLSNDNFEIGHGFMVIKLLVDLLNIYNKKNYDKSNLAYTNTLSVLKSFYNKHSNTEYVNDIKNIFGEWLEIILNDNSDIGGAKCIDYKSKEDNDKKGFKKLSEERFSIRTYSNKEVSENDIKDAIQISMKTPTACNRQPFRVYSIYKKDLIKNILEVQGGITSYDTPPVLLLITTDDSSYVGFNERNQGYVDGGLFSMSLLYALEYKKLAACPLHTMFETERDFAIRGLLDIPDSEKLITFISVGHFSKVNNVCKSFRYSAESVYKKIEKLYAYRIEDIEQKKDCKDNILDKSKNKIKIRTRIKYFISSINKKIKEILNRIISLIRYRKIDGAILTLTGYFNYGNVIQRFALQKFLKNNNLNFISYLDPYSAPRDAYYISRTIKLKTPLRALKRLIRNQKPYWYIPKYSEIYPEAYNIENIINFVNNNIKVKPFDLRDKFKTYIVGSDQVWRNWWNDREKLGYYFFNFLRGKKANRISYAASFGKDIVEDVVSSSDIDYIRPYIENFDSISVREKSGIELIKDAWGIYDVKEVVDPTLLLSTEDYSELIDKSDVVYEKIQPIFTYFLDETPEHGMLVNKIQDKRKQSVTRIRAHAGSENDVLPTVEFWLKGFRDADLVITNSFHGMMLSIVNNTDFIIIGRKDGGLSRIGDFLLKYGIEGRFINEGEIGDFDTAELKEINWKEVNKKINHSRKESGDWLLSNINK